MKSVQLPDGTSMPALGLGTWHMGESPASARAEENALRHGIEQGIRLIDTAEMYGEGGAERVLGRAIAGRRDELFLVSKVYPHNASVRGAVAACERSLSRLNTDRLDLYLLHWRGGIALEQTIEAFEKLVRDGKILRWGVSNFDLDDMQELAALDAGQACAVNQVYYSASRRGVEHDLLPWLRERSIPLMAYCPLDEGMLASDETLAQIGRAHGATAAQVAIAWLMSQPGVVPIPKAGRLAHVEQIHAAQELVLTESDFALIDQSFPPPTRREPLMIV